ncbi:unnamed protein product [Coregonus sp. 'balchen']|nr:unnamed protein product [Coregonus sp. 'balchen']
MTTWSDQMLQVLRRMSNFYSPAKVIILAYTTIHLSRSQHFCLYHPCSSRTTCHRFEVGGEQIVWVPCQVASIFSQFPEVFNPPHGGAITLRQNCDFYRRRSEAVDSVLQPLRREGSLTVLKGWRNESLRHSTTVYGEICDTPLMCMERSATMKLYGVHINGYCQDENGELRMWVG